MMDGINLNRSLRKSEGGSAPLSCAVGHVMSLGTLHPPLGAATAIGGLEGTTLLTSSGRLTVDEEDSQVRITLSLFLDLVPLRLLASPSSKLRELSRLVLLLAVTKGDSRLISACLLLPLSDLLKLAARSGEPELFIPLSLAAIAAASLKDELRARLFFSLVGQDGSSCKALLLLPLKLRGEPDRTRELPREVGV